MKLALIGPSELTDFDKREIEENLEDFISKGNQIILLAYRSIEIEVFKFFIERMNDDNSKNIASLLHIHTFQPFSLLPDKIKESINFLVENGASFHSFEFEEILIKRTMYIETWQTILKEADALICFYDGAKSTLMIPVDEAKKMQKKSVIYNLPNFNEEHFLLNTEEKIRIIDEF